MESVAYQMGEMTGKLIAPAIFIYLGYIAGKHFWNKRKAKKLNAKPQPN